MLSTALRKLIWLTATQQQGGGGTEQTVTGTLPLTLQNALSHAILSLTRYGLCTQDGTPTPDAPVDILCNNGALRMLNLANIEESNLDIGYYINNNGNRLYNASNFYTLGFVPVKPNTTYTMSVSSPVNYFNVMEYDSAQGWIKRTLYGSTGEPAGTVITFTTTETTAFIRWGSNMVGGTVTYEQIAAVNWMLTDGETPMEYVPFGQISVVGTPEVLTMSASGAADQTASVPMLLSVGDYKDEAEIISGIKTGKVGIKVFDGTESFGKSSAYGAAFYIQSAAGAWGAKRETVMCSHFLGMAPATGQREVDTCFFNSSGHFYFRVEDNSDTAAFNVWLAEQYAAGTPIIVLYPLATETTEQTTAQHLNTVEGTNIVDSVANVGPVEAKVEYYAA